MPVSSQLLEDIRANNLSEINLASKNIRDDDIVILAGVIQTNTSVKLLNLANNRFEERGAQALGEMLKVNKSLKLLNISNNTIGDEGAKALAEGLKDNSTLVHLNLDRAFLFDTGIVSLCNALQSSRVQSLNLSNNIIEEKACKALADVIRSTATLKSLQLIGSFFNADAMPLARAFESNKSLNTLDLQNNNLSSKIIYEILKALSNNPNLQLKDINLSHNIFDAFCVKELLALLASKAKIENLKLCKVKLCDDMLAGLPEFPEKNIHLQKLDLSRNKLTKISALNICERLRWGHALIELDLSGNELGLEGGIEIGQVLATHPSLQVLNISCCKLEDKGSIAILNGINNNKLLRELYLSGNQITSESVIAISSLLENNKTLQVLGLSGNLLTNDCFKSIVNALQNNSSLLQLDLSYNVAQSTEDKEALAKIDACLKRNREKYARLNHTNKRPFQMGILESSLNNNKRPCGNLDRSGNSPTV